MKKSGFFPIFTITLSIFLTLIIGAAQAEKVVKVQIHTVQGGKVTEANLIEGIKAANQADGPYIRFVIDSNHVHRPGSTPKDANLNDKGRVNIWGLDKCAVTGEPNYVSGQKGNIIEIVPGFKPSGPNEPNVWLKPSTLAHEIDHILLGPAHSDDPNNKMYPDNDDHNKTEPVHSCHRKGTQLTPEQIQKLKDTNVPYVQNAVGISIGAEIYDIAGDVPRESGVDIDWTEGWMEWVHGEYIVHLTVQFDVVSFFDLPTEDGFFLNSDGDPTTGQPPEGLDCYLAYNPHLNEMIFQRYDNLGGGWINEAPPEGVSYELTYTSKDANVPPKPSGVRFTGPLKLFMIGQTLTGNFAFEATGTNKLTQERDRAPDANMLKITYPTNPIPGDLNLDNKVDESDLEIMTWDWPETGTSRADIFPPFGDDVVDFIDYAILANNWLIGLP